MAPLARFCGAQRGAYLDYPPTTTFDMIPATSTSSDKEPIAPTSFGSVSERRLSDSTISPPPYEPIDVERSLLIHDEKLRQIEEHQAAEVSYQASATDAKMKQVYAEQPSAFSRIPAINFQALTPFHALTVLVEGSGRSLDKGFSLDLPPSLENIHPFARRDIKASDWVRFMQDLKNGTAMSNRAKHQTFLVPLALGLGPGAFFISKAVKAHIRRKKLAYAINLINTWNQQFFNPRRVEVILMRGSDPLTISRSTQRENPGYDSQCDDLALVSRSSHCDSSSSSLEANKSFGRCSQPTTPMQLVVASI